MEFSEAFSTLSLFCDLLTCSGKCWLCGKSDHVAAGLMVQQSKCLALLLGGLPPNLDPMAFQTTGARHTASLQGKPRNLAEHFCNPWWNIVEPCGTRVESLQNFVEPCETSGPTALAESCGTLQPSENRTSNHSGPPLLEPCWNLHGTLPCKTWWNSVQPSWNLTSNQPGPQLELW